MKTLLLIAVRNLIQNRKRSLLLGSAIALVTLLLVMLTALFNGMQETMLRSATTLMTGHVNVAGFFKVTSGTAAPVVTKHEAVRAVVEKATQGITSVVVRGRGWGKVISDVSSQQAAIVGIDIDTEKGFREVVQIKTGSMDGLREPGTMLMFDATAKRLEVKVGDKVTVSAPTFRGVNNTIDLRVVAIARDLGMFSGFNTYVHHDAIRDLFQMDASTVGAIQVYLADPDAAAEVAARLRKVVAEAGYRVMDPVSKPFWMKFQTVTREDWTGQKIDITTWMDEMQFIRYTLQTLQALIVILGSVLLVIIVIGVMNTLWMSIRERTREIGTLRAIGMQRGTILRMFVLEGAVMAVLATTVGVAAATGLAAGLTAVGIVVPEAFQMFLMSETLRLIVDTKTAVGALVLISLFTTLGALYPAWRAARMQPVTAMHSA